jgi:hypothetical protein
MASMRRRPKAGPVAIGRDLGETPHRPKTDLRRGTAAMALSTRPGEKTRMSSKR